MAENPRVTKWQIPWDDTPQTISVANGEENMADAAGDDMDMMGEADDHNQMQHEMLAHVQQPGQTIC